VCPVPMSGIMQITDKARAIINTTRVITDLGQLYLYTFLSAEHEKYLFLNRL